MATNINKPLTDKQRRFVAFIVAGENIVDAYKKAGYGKKSSHVTQLKDSSRMNKLPHIAKAIKVANKAAGIEIDIESEEKEGQDRKIKILKELERIAFDRDISPNNGKLKALEMLGKHHGMFTDKVEHGVASGNKFTFIIEKPNRETD